MKFANVMTYDAPAATVYAMVTDPEFQSRRAQAGKPEQFDSSVNIEAGGGAEIHLMRLMAVRLPGMLQRLTGDRIRIQETQTWADAQAEATERTGRLKVGIAGQSGGVDGRLSMTETEGKTRIDLDADIKVHIPLVGGKIENFVAEMLAKFLTWEQELGSAWLAGDHPA